MHDTLSRRSLMAGALGLAGAALVGSEAAADESPVSDELFNTDPNFGILQSLDLRPFYEGDPPDLMGLPIEEWSKHQPPTLERGWSAGNSRFPDPYYLTIFSIEDEWFIWDGEHVERGAWFTPQAQHPWTAKIKIIPPVE